MAVSPPSSSPAYRRKSSFLSKVDGSDSIQVASAVADDTVVAPSDSKNVARLTADHLRSLDHVTAATMTAKDLDTSLRNPSNTTVLTAVTTATSTAHISGVDGTANKNLSLLDASYETSCANSSVCLDNSLDAHNLSGYGITGMSGLGISMDLIEERLDEDADAAAAEDDNSVILPRILFPDEAAGGEGPVDELLEYDLADLADLSEDEAQAREEDEEGDSTPQLGAANSSLDESIDKPPLDTSFDTSLMDDCSSSDDSAAADDHRSSSAVLIADTSLDVPQECICDIRKPPDAPLGLNLSQDSGRKTTNRHRSTASLTGSSFLDTLDQSINQLSESITYTLCRPNGSRHRSGGRSGVEGRARPADDLVGPGDRLGSGYGDLFPASAGPDANAASPIKGRRSRSNHSCGTAASMEDESFLRRNMECLLGSQHEPSEAEMDAFRDFNLMECYGADMTPERPAGRKDGNIADTPVAPRKDKALTEKCCEQPSAKTEVTAGGPAFRNRSEFPVKVRSKRIHQLLLQRAYPEGAAGNASAFAPSPHRSSLEKGAMPSLSARRRSVLSTSAVSHTVDTTFEPSISFEENKENVEPYEVVETSVISSARSFMESYESDNEVEGNFPHYGAACGNAVPTRQDRRGKTRRDDQSSRQDANTSADLSHLIGGCIEPIPTMVDDVEASPLTENSENCSDQTQTEESDLCYDSDPGITEAAFDRRRDFAEGRSKSEGQADAKERCESFKKPSPRKMRHALRFSKANVASVQVGCYDHARLH